MEEVKGNFLKWVSVYDEFPVEGEAVLVKCYSESDETPEGYSVDVFLRCDGWQLYEDVQSWAYFNRDINCDKSEEKVDELGVPYFEDIKFYEEPRKEPWYKRFLP